VRFTLAHAVLGISTLIGVTSALPCIAQTRVTSLRSCGARWPPAI
jgi:hypothetical protein